jgi:hypothetical protein
MGVRCWLLRCWFVVVARAAAEPGGPIRHVRINGTSPVAARDYIVPARVVVDWLRDRVGPDDGSLSVPDDGWEPDDDGRRRFELADLVRGGDQPGGCHLPRNMRITALIVR